jgi:hypothetical protein
VSGLVVTFPHASPHTITARFGASGPTAAVTVDVIPTAVSGGGELGNTGRDLSPVVGGAAALLGLGALALVGSARMRRASS